MSSLGRQKLRLTGRPPCVWSAAMSTPTDTENDGPPSPGDRPTTAQKSPSDGARKKPVREDRLADALRDNLRRRKAGEKKENKDA